MKYKTNCPICGGNVEQCIENDCPLSQHIRKTIKEDYENGVIEFDFDIEKRELKIIYNPELKHIEIKDIINVFGDENEQTKKMEI